MHTRRRKIHSPTSVALVRGPLRDKSALHAKKVECLGIASLAAVCRHQKLADPVLVDAELDDLDIKSTCRALLALDPDVIGFTNPLHYLPEEITAIIAFLRADRYDGWIVLGGTSPTFYGVEALREVPGLDAVFLGNADISFPLFLLGLNEENPFASVPGVTYRGGNTFVTQPAAARKSTLDLLPPVARDLTTKIIEKGALAALYTSRGCYHGCSFCSIPSFYQVSGQPSWQARSADLVAREMRDLAEYYGVTHALIVDEEFFGSKALKRGHAFAEALKKNGSYIEFALSCRSDSIEPESLGRLAQTGLRHVYLGIESGSSADLQLFNKKTTRKINQAAINTVERTGLSVQVGTIVLHPKATVETIRETYSFLREIGHHGLLCQTTCWQPYHGTPLVDRLAEKGAIIRRGTRLLVHYTQPWQTFLAVFFSVLQKRFLPYYLMVARLNDSCTFKWRPLIANRSAAARQALDIFERGLNDITANLLDQALDIVAGRDPAHQDLDRYHAQSTTIVEHAEMAAALSALGMSAVLQAEDDPFLGWDRHDGSATAELSSKERR